MTAFRLNALEAQTPLWRMLKQHLEQRRDQLRAQNESTTLDATATAVLRGRIAELKLLMAIDRHDQDEDGVRHVG
jgi:hypothetical protein